LTHFLKFGFDPTAKAPRFRSFLGQIFDADPKTLKPNAAGDGRAYVVQETFGYSLLPDNRFQKFIVFDWVGVRFPGGITEYGSLLVRVG
jgi:hypothetical protein